MRGCQQTRSAVRARPGRGAARPASIHSQDKHDLLGRIERYLDDTARAAEAEQVFKELESDPRSRKVEPPMPEGWTRINFIPGISSTRALSRGARPPDTEEILHQDRGVLDADSATTGGQKVSPTEGGPRAPLRAVEPNWRVTSRISNPRGGIAECRSWRRPTWRRPPPRCAQRSATSTS